MFACSICFRIGGIINDIETNFSAIALTTLNNMLVEYNEIFATYQMVLPYNRLREQTFNRAIRLGIDEIVYCLQNSSLIDHCIDYAYLKTLHLQRDDISDTLENIILKTWSNYNEMVFINYAFDLTKILDKEFYRDFIKQKAQLEMFEKQQHSQKVHSNQMSQMHKESKRALDKMNELQDEKNRLQAHKNFINERFVNNLHSK